MRWPQVMLLGPPFWQKTCADILKQINVGTSSYEETLSASRQGSFGQRWIQAAGRLSSGPFRRSEAIHSLTPTSAQWLYGAARMLGKRVFLHWIGSDVLKLGQLLRQNPQRWLSFYRHVAQAHFADSPELADELADLGLQAELFRLLPSSIVPQDPLACPFPEKPGVLFYWSSQRREFYGGAVADGLIRAFPDVAFYVVGSDGVGEFQANNLTYLGKVSNMEDAYRKISVFIRMPEHDSLSAMVLECLARGRFVIYSKPFPHTQMARTLEEARGALRRCLDEPAPNIEGATFVLEHFTADQEAQRIRSVYHRALGFITSEGS